MAERFTVIDKRDGFNLCARENLRSPFETRAEAQRLAGDLNATHPRKPFAVTVYIGGQKYYRAG